MPKMVTQIPSTSPEPEGFYELPINIVILSFIALFWTTAYKVRAGISYRWIPKALMELHLKELNHVGCKLIKAVSRTTDIVVENRQFKKQKPKEYVRMP